MAVVTSQDYKNTLYLPDSIQILTIFFDNAEVDSNLIQKVKLKDTLFDGTTFSLGSTAITELEIVFDDSINIPSTIQLYYSLQTNEQVEVGAFNVGFFDVISYDNSSKGCIKVQAQDYMNRFNKPIDISNIVPCTRLEVIQYLCNQCNVALGVNTFLNANITTDVYDNNITAQKYIAYIAERAGGFARINCICFQSREYEIRNELFRDIFDDALDSTALESLLFEVIVIDTDAYFTAVSNYFTIVVLKEPRDDDGCIQSA